MKKLLVTTSLLLMAACSKGDDTANDAKPEADTSATHQQTSGSIKVYALDCGRIEMNDLSIFSLEDEYAGRTNSAADMCVLVRHPKGDLMWDSGLPMALADMENGLTNGPFHLSVPTTIKEQFDAIGITVDDIDYFSISHSHFDHVGNGGMFAGATFLVDKDERAYMFREDARVDAQTFGAYSALESAETIEFDGDYDVFGDGTVMILGMPGHTPGHTTLLVTLDNSGPIMFSGDLYHLNELRERRLMPKFNVDVDDTYASMDRFEQMSGERNARVVIQHSVEDFEELPKLPEYLD